ncbi:MAG: hypothetical protein K0S21_3646, partial [Rhizobiaceae bacterium]|nr:hypothetical protein [Rhizobiaceae bacterium]
MADFVAVLRKTLDGLGDPDPALRARVYDKARATVAGKIAALDPPPPPGVAERQQRSLEDAIAAIEREYVEASAAADPLAELEHVFASLKNPQPKPMARPAPAAEAPPSTREFEANREETPSPPEEPRFDRDPEPADQPQPPDRRFFEEPEAAKEPRFAEKRQVEDEL